MKIPFFRYPHVFQQHEEELRSTILDVAARGAFIMQAELKEFEERLAEYCGVGHAIGTGNATDALELVLAASGIGEGDEIIMPSHTFVASAASVVAVGGRPVFADIGPDHLMDPDDVEHRITERTRGMMPTQLNGRTAAMEGFEALAEEHGLLLFEDSAQGLGSRYRGRMAGTFGVGGVYSFYPAKTLGALGDGGAVITDDADLAASIRQLRDHGRDEATGEVSRWGRNSRLDNLQAAVLLVKLRHFQDEIDARRRVADWYGEQLASLDALRLPPAPEPEGSAHYDVFQNYEIEAEDRDGLRAHLSEAGVGTLLQWGGRGVHQFPALAVNASLPRTESILARSLLLPMNSSVTEEEVGYIAETIRGFYGRG